jgi:hypothetical protein
MQNSFLLKTTRGYILAPIDGSTQSLFHCHTHQTSDVEVDLLTPNDVLHHMVSVDARMLGKGILIFPCPSKKMMA